MGTSLALTGAYVLAGELAAANHCTALDRYETVLRPYVEQAQKLKPGAPHIANPRSRAGVGLLRTVLKAASPAADRVGGLANRLFSPPADAIELPTYPAPPIPAVVSS